MKLFKYTIMIFLMSTFVISDPVYGDGHIKQNEDTVGGHHGGGGGGGAPPPSGGGGG